MFKQTLAITVLLLSGCVTQDSSTYKQKTIPERVNAWNNVAREYIRLEQYENAKEPLKQALDIDSKAGISLMLMAFVFQRQGEKVVAEEYYKKALKASSADAVINNNYGVFLLIEERYSEACQYLALAANDPLYDQRTRALENLASCYQRSGRLKDAEQSYLRVLRINPNSTSAILELGMIEFDREGYAKARQYFERYSSLVRLNQADYTAKSLYLGVLLARKNNDPGQSSTFALLLKNMYPDSAEYQRYKEAR